MNKAKLFSPLSVKTALFLFLCAGLLLTCKKGEKPAPDALDSDTSYAFGMLIAEQMGLKEVHFDYEAFKEGFRDVNEAEETRLTMENAYEKLNVVFARLQAQNSEKMWLEGEKNRETGEAYMAENGARSEVTTTASGLQYEVLSRGNGAKPDSTDTVQVHYEGTLIDGTVFDSSYARNSPLEFPLDGVIAGWNEGVQLMNVGSTYRFVIPSDLAYGPGGAGTIPPNATLIFKVELISILK
jgi:FKBP-type peptidyl-prolyl cis-trans isomerase